VVAPTGTVTTKLVAVALVTVADVPLNFTVLLDGVESNPVPLIVTEAPIGPIDGVNDEIVGMLLMS
jgi:hypothetical protein